MRKIEIVGKNYAGHWDTSRVACRAIIKDEDRILLSYGERNDLWMLPGGGREEKESLKDCCRREVQEETGYVVQTNECFLEIDEYYETCCYISYYFYCNLLSMAERHLTEAERQMQLSMKWMKMEDIRDIFKNYAVYDGIDEVRRGMYQREYAALCELDRIEKEGEIL